MHLCCPACGFKSPIEVFAQDKDARHLAALMGRVPPPLADLALRYVALFAPAKHAMTFSRGRAVLGPLVEMIEAGRIERAKRGWPISLAQFEAGLQHMVERRAQLTLPLKTHGYLLEVLAGLADRIEAKAEAETIERQRRGGAPQTDEDAPAATDALTLQKARAEAVQKLAGEIAACKRLVTPLSRAYLRTVLLREGVLPEHADFALGRHSELQP